LGFRTTRDVVRRHNNNVNFVKTVQAVMEEGQRQTDKSGVQVRQSADRNAAIVE
jgi:hypothetical protein